MSIAIKIFSTSVFCCWLVRYGSQFLLMMRRYFILLVHSILFFLTIAVTAYPFTCTNKCLVDLATVLLIVLLANITVLPCATSTRFYAHVAYKRQQYCVSNKCRHGSTANIVMAHTVTTAEYLSRNNGRNIWINTNKTEEKNSLHSCNRIHGCDICQTRYHHEKSILT